MNKYEFTGEEKKIHTPDGEITLKRIRAKIDIDSVKAGDLGGWIESENNLSDFGNARVFEDARVSGNARVFEDALVFGNDQVFGNAEVSGNAWVFGNVDEGEKNESVPCTD